MMEKTYFMHVYNIIICFLILALLTGIFSMFFWILNIGISQVHIIDVSHVTPYITLLSSILRYAAIFFVGLPVVLTLIDLIMRYAKDKVTNHFKSVYHTIFLRRYLKQDDHVNPSNDWQPADSTNSTHIRHYFNKYVGKSMVDIQQNDVRIAIKIPHKQQAHEILKGMEEQIYEEITHLHPDYYFSAPQRYHHYLWFKGLKK